WKNIYRDSLFRAILKEDDYVNVHGKDLFETKYFLGSPVSRKNYGFIIDSISLPQKRKYLLYSNGRGGFSPDKETLEKLMSKKDSVIRSNELARKKLRQASDSIKHIAEPPKKGVLYWDESRNKYSVMDTGYEELTIQNAEIDTASYSPRNINPEYTNQLIQIQFKTKSKKDD
ncbi:MAG TPA: hypothetical protein VEC16_04405, partial [Alphaproteobacteria bacterium]|nr:hypothetical protein [Alphaproteobacteria bacterium]